MTAILGHNLLISTDGMVIGAAKSCNVSIKSDSIEVASPNDGRWKHHREGRMEWKVSTNYIYVDESQHRWTITAQGAAYDNFTTKDRFIDTGSDRVFNPTDRGITVCEIDKTTQLITNTTNYDTWETPSEMAALASYLNNVGSDVVVALICSDAMAIDNNIISGLHRIGISETIEPFVGNCSFAAIGGVGMQGIMRINKKQGTVTQVSMQMIRTEQQTVALIKDKLTKAGQFFELSFNVNGYPYDKMRGRALCTTAKVSATNGNIASGSFEFVGDGPLE